ncbi:hypothetical protein CMV_008601 [Castanea mollissima]|uniref:Transmembrane protein n=1 Tax=Castanea mollissima TaxID=60419 RepID=A0A8J4VP51_9ROSI|nr:hypothetical protein CMV_008601 [Castanea mollissima]
MFSEKNVFTIVKVVMIMILTLFIVNSKPVETTRPFVVMKSKKIEIVKVVSVSRVRALIPPSAPNPCTYLPGPPTCMRPTCLRYPRTRCSPSIFFFFSLSILKSPKASPEPDMAAPRPPPS